MPGGAKRRCECRALLPLPSTFSRIPARFRGATLDSYEPQNPRQLSAKVALSEHPTASYALIGPYGTGKTHLLCAQYRIFLERGIAAVFRSTREIVDEVIKAEISGEQSEVLERLGRDAYFHLFWDDADKFKPTEYKAEVLYHVVDRLYANCFGLSLTTNHPLAGSGGNLQEKLGPAIVRRIYDMCVRLEL